MRPYFYPQVEKSLLFAQGYIAVRSGHSRGSTVDLTLVDEQTGKELDMGGAFDYFGERPHPGYTGLTQEQLANRNMLRQVMLDHGFRPLETEWCTLLCRMSPIPTPILILW